MVCGLALTVWRMGSQPVRGQPLVSVILGPLFETGFLYLSIDKLSELLFLGILLAPPISPQGMLGLDACTRLCRCHAHSGGHGQ